MTDENKAKAVSSLLEQSLPAEVTKVLGHIRDHKLAFDLVQEPESSRSSVFVADLQGHLHHILSIDTKNHDLDRCFLASDCVVDCRNQRKVVCPDGRLLTLPNGDSNSSVFVRCRTGCPMFEHIYSFFTRDHGLTAHQEDTRNTGGAHPAHKFQDANWLNRRESTWRYIGAVAAGLSYLDEDKWLHFVVKQLEERDNQQGAGIFPHLDETANEIKNLVQAYADFVRPIVEYVCKFWNSPDIPLLFDTAYAPHLVGFSSLVLQFVPCRKLGIRDMPELERFRNIVTKKLKATERAALETAMTAVKLAQDAGAVALGGGETKAAAASIMRPRKPAKRASVIRDQEAAQQVVYGCKDKMAEVEPWRLLPIQNEEAKGSPMMDLLLEEMDPADVGAGPAAAKAKAQPKRKAPATGGGEEAKKKKRRKLGAGAELPDPAFEDADGPEDGYTPPPRQEYKHMPLFSAGELRRAAVEHAPPPPPELAAKARKDLKAYLVAVFEGLGSFGYVSKLEYSIAARCDVPATQCLNQTTFDKVFDEEWAAAARQPKQT